MADATKGWWSVPPAKMCASCRREWWDWLDYRPVPPIRIHTVGGNRPQDLKAAEDARVRGIYERIREQLDLIERSCARDHRGEYVPPLTGIVGMRRTA